MRIGYSSGVNLQVETPIPHPAPAAPQSTVPPPSRSGRLAMQARNVLFWMHLAVGSITGAVIFVMAASGICLNLQKTVIAWAERDARHVVPAPTPRLDADQLLAKARQLDTRRPRSLLFRSQPNDAVEVTYGREGGIFVNPYTGALAGRSADGVREAFAFAERVHRNLGEPLQGRKLGRSVSEAVNLLFLVLLVSGLVLWIPRRWTKAAVSKVALPSWQLRGRARNWNWHHVAGLWCALPLLVITLSGVVMSYPWATDLLFRATGSEQRTRAKDGAKRKRDKREKRENDGEALYRLQPAWSAALATGVAWNTIALRIPDGGETVNVTIDQGNGGQPDRRFDLTVDGSGQVVKRQTFESNNFGQRLRSMMKYIHSGEEWSWPGQTAMVFGSGGAMVLCWTGLSLALGRLRGLLRARRA